MINKKNRTILMNNSVFDKKAATYSPTKCSTICAKRFNFSVRNGKR